MGDTESSIETATVTEPTCEAEARALRHAAHRYHTAKDELSKAAAKVALYDAARAFVAAEQAS
jgi:hypothetical protein